MKTDIIILGAGASASAGFPINAGLVNYMIETLPKLPREGKLPAELHVQWAEISERLRRTSILSVDEFCQLAKTPDQVKAVKQMLRVAMYQNTFGWHSIKNEYRTFVESLFLKPSGLVLNPQFVVINFNYDGLLGKMITDAVIERHIWNKQERPNETLLANVSGGIYHCYFHPKGYVGRCKTSYSNQDNEFAHYMPHGSFTAYTDGTTVGSLSDVIYSTSTPVEERERQFYNSYYYDPMIQFPSEPEEQYKFFAEQVACAGQAVAKSVNVHLRVHFIGISGHKLMAQTLKRIFRLACGLPSFTSIEWHIATKDDPEETYLKILDCLLPDHFEPAQKAVLIENAKNNKLKKYPDFADWLRRKPHLSIG